MKQTPFLCIALGLMSCLASERAPLEGSDTRGDDNARAPTTLDIAEFRKYGEGKLRDAANGLSLSNFQVYFQDGAASTDLMPFDMGRLVLTADAEEGIADLKFAFYVGMNGDTSEVGLVAVETYEQDGQQQTSLIFHGLDVIAFLNDGANSEALLGQLQSSFPTANLRHLESLGLIIAATKDLRILFQIYRTLSDSSDVQLTEPVQRIIDNPSASTQLSIWVPVKSRRWSIS